MMQLEPGELLMAVEEEFGVSISDEEAKAIQTPALLIDAILDKAPRQLRSHVAALVKEIVTDGLGIPEEDYHEDIPLGEWLV
jgi:hypothetical protein